MPSLGGLAPLRVSIIDSLFLEMAASAWTTGPEGSEPASSSPFEPYFSGLFYP